jgi:hypothetical protein
MQIEQEGAMVRTLATLVLAGFTSSISDALLHAQQGDRIPNNFPHRNPGGYGATFSTQGVVDLTGEYFQAQGTNGRSCATCHVQEERGLSRPPPCSGSLTRPAARIRCSTISMPTTPRCR